MFMHTISLIAAMAKNRVIGCGGKIPWSLPDDLQYFKKVTMGASIIMGRKTHESIGRVLPGRKNIVLSSQDGYKPFAGALLAPTLSEGLILAGDGEVFIIGGERVYSEAFPFASRLYLTEVLGEFFGDTFFPEFSRDEWKEISRERFSYAERVIFERK
jgi:dihydrofolate reductase